MTEIEFLDSLSWWGRFGYNWRLFRGITPWDHAGAPWREDGDVRLVMCKVSARRALRAAFENASCREPWYLAWLRFKCRLLYGL